MASSANTTGLIVYRWFDGDGVLLYVGCGSDLQQRTARHGNYAPWWPRAYRCEALVYPTRQEAEDAERAAIRDELPEFNQTRSLGSTPVQRERVPPRPSDACDLCGKPLPPLASGRGRPLTRHPACQAAYRRTYYREKKRQQRAISRGQDS